MRFGDLTYEEIRQFAETGAIAVVPTGCTEQQGPHLTVDGDTWFADTLCVAAAERLEKEYSIRVLVLPAMPFGPTPEHRGFGSGYIDIPEGTHQELVMAVLESLADQGFRKIIVWRGCGGHKLAGAIDAFNESHREQAQAFLPEPPFHKIWKRLGDPRDPGGHADSFITSIWLYLRRDHVREDRIVDSSCKPVDWDRLDLDFTEYSPTGVIGTPICATRELGEKLWDATVKEVSELFKRLSEARDTI